MTILITKERYEQELVNASDGPFLRDFAGKLGRAPTAADYKTLQTRYMTHLNRPAADPAEVMNWSPSWLKFGKSTRPWFFINPASVLPADQVWVGFEVETGYRSREDLTTALGKLARCKQLIALDVEGSGAQPLEVTFFPVALADIEKKGGPSRIIDMYTSVSPAIHRPDGLVGTHFNFSTPTMRSSGLRFRLRDVGTAIHRLTGNQRVLLFGRSRVYGPTPYWRGSHVECKWFNTTYNKSVWKRYCRVIRAFVAEVQAVEAGAPQRWNAFFNTLAGREQTRLIREANRSRRAS